MANCWSQAFDEPCWRLDVTPRLPGKQLKSVSVGKGGAIPRVARKTSLVKCQSFI